MFAGIGLLAPVVGLVAAGIFFAPESAGASAVAAVCGSSLAVGYATAVSAVKAWVGEIQPEFQERLRIMQPFTDALAAFCSRLQGWADAPEGRWRERLSIPGAIDLLAFDTDGTTPVGMATGIPSADYGSRAELISMWVDPAVRGRGVATVLITAIARWAASTGATTLTLFVMLENVAARRVYERNGFAVSNEPDDLPPGDRRALVMLRDLGLERSVND